MSNTPNTSNESQKTAPPSDNKSGTSSNPQAQQNTKPGQQHDAGKNKPAPESGKNAAGSDKKETKRL